MPASSENDAMLENPCLLDSDSAGSNQKCKSNFVFENNLPLDSRPAHEFSKFLEENVHVRYNLDCFGYFVDYEPCQYMNLGN